MSLAFRLAESGFVPDWIVRAGIRSLLRQRVREERRESPEALEEHRRLFLSSLRSGPIAVDTAAPNEQHYEVPPEFFIHTLGKRLKYSCCYFAAGNESLDEAEEIMLALTCERAGIEDGMDLLELGCGWGSLTLWIAECYPKARITAVSNSRPQREFILARCRELGYSNVTVTTADMNQFTTDLRFDRILSIEMFEHMRNYEVLLRRIASWMKPAARLFVHVFCHREFAYAFETEGRADWMGRTFFTGGIMPSYNLLFGFQDDMAIENHWRVSGTHYQRTAEHWLRNVDSHRRRIMPVFETTYGARDAKLWFQRWRIFFMACAELWGFRGGEEWLVAHYLFRKKSG